jgi:hypothetical protein
LGIKEIDALLGLVGRVTLRLRIGSRWASSGSHANFVQYGVYTFSAPGRCSDQGGDRLPLGQEGFDPVVVPMCPTTIISNA